MLTASDIKNINFSSSMRGYKVEEVDALLDNVEADYLQYERIIGDYKEQNAVLQAEIDELKRAQESIQNVLINAQKLADKIVSDAKEKSEEIVKNAEANINVITEQEKELAKAFEAKANERKAALQKELEVMTQKAQIKADGIMAAATDAVERQQMLFDKLKLEIANFKATITSKYKEHLSILQDIPDTVEQDPKMLGEIISAKVDELPDVNLFITIPSISEKAEEPAVEAVEESSGFVVEEI